MPGSVAYVIGQDYKLGGSLVAAQQFALKHKLPLAVVYCLADWNPKILKKLQLVEKELAVKHIPLIVLIGAPDTTLAGFVHHTKPLQIFNETSETYAGKLTNHPHLWPGKVITITELTELQVAGKINC